MTPCKAIALLAALALLCATPGPVAAAAAAAKNGKCAPDSIVIVEIKGIRFAVPRTAEYHVTLDDGVTRMALGRPGPGYTCDTPVLPNIRALATASYAVGFMATRHNPTERKFNETRKAILSASNLRGSKVEKMPTGIQKTSAPAIGADFFQLPLDAAPTGDHVPVAILCDNSESKELAKILPRFCTAFYIHPSGLPFTYGILRDDFPNDDFIAADQANRKVVDDMIAAAKEKKDIENKDK